MCGSYESNNSRIFTISYDDVDCVNRWKFIVVANLALLFFLSVHFLPSPPQCCCFLNSSPDAAFSEGIIQDKEFMVALLSALLAKWEMERNDFTI